VTVWLFGGLAARRERNKADERLVATVSAADKAYADVAAQRRPRARAARAANSPKVQRAFMHSDREALRRLERQHPGVTLVQGPKIGATGERIALARIPLSARGKTIGSAVVLVPARSLLPKLFGTTDPGRVGILLPGQLALTDKTIPQEPWPPLRKTTDLVVGGSKNRVVALAVPNQGGRAALIALKPRSEIDAAAGAARWRVVGLGLGLIGALLVLAYAMAPALARSRLSRQQRDQAERVIAHLGDGVFVVDRDGVIRLWNQAAEAITGLHGADVRGRKAEEAIPGWTTIVTFVPVADRPGQGDGPSSSETVPLDIAGRELWLSIVAVALDDDTVYAFRDATHDRRLENLRSQFVATISHEIRTPLASLHGAALTLREHDLPVQTQDDLLEMIAEQSNRLANLVEEILVAGQLDSGSLHVVVDTFDPDELVRGVVAAARSRLGEATTIAVAAPPIVPKVHGDPERTRQVLLNLLDNAIKYSPSGGQIEVELAAMGDRLRFSVHDQGLGIPVGEQERIFDKFYRLDPDQRRGIGGTGLGLYICRELVRSMHGSIWVDSEPGKGTTFAFELPAEPVPAPV
jgi:two-component system, OmpR family, phosphate regulon sensor histidine kinase PhoR